MIRVSQMLSPRGKLRVSISNRYANFAVVEQRAGHEVLLEELRLRCAENKYDD
jgi:hypothetical protein